MVFKGTKYPFTTDDTKVQFKKMPQSINHGHKYCLLYRRITYSHSFFNEIIKIRHFMLIRRARATHDLTITITTYVGQVTVQYNSIV